MSRASILKSSIDGFYTVVTPYEPGFVSDLKSFIDPPFRKWDPQAKQWLVEKTHLEALILIMENYFDEIHTDISESAQPDGNLFEPVFSVVPKDYRQKVYQALAQAVHPDHGGNSALMVQLNEAYQKQGG